LKYEKVKSGEWRVKRVYGLAPDVSGLRDGIGIISLFLKQKSLLPPN
jgi:hypothetical protein